MTGLNQGCWDSTVLLSRKSTERNSRWQSKHTGGLLGRPQPEVFAQHVPPVDASISVSTPHPLPLHVTRTCDAPEERTSQSSAVTQAATSNPQPRSDVCVEPKESAPPHSAFMNGVFVESCCSISLATTMSQVVSFGKGTFKCTSTLESCKYGIIR